MMGAHTTPHSLGLRVRLRDGIAARLRERDGVSVVQAGQSNRPHGRRRYLVGYGVNVSDAVAERAAVAVADEVPEPERLAEAVAGDVRLAVRVRVVAALGEGVRLRDVLLVRLPLLVPLDDGVPVVLEVKLRLPVALDEGVSVLLDVELRLAVALDEGVPVVLDVELRVAVALDDGVPVRVLEDVELLEPVPV